jgi:hypothetical protein
MKKFRYRLEPLLKIKSHVEKQRQKEHAAALQQVYRQQEVLAEIDALRQTTLRHQADRRQGRLSSVELQMATRYFSKLRRDTPACEAGRSNQTEEDFREAQRKAAGTV